jgi:hypothetical protein
VGNRHWPSDPHDPYARSQRRDDDGSWVVAGEDPAPSYSWPEHEAPDYRQPPQRYGQGWHDPRADRYPPQQPPYQASPYQTPADPYGGYDPPPARYPAAYPARQPPRRQPPPQADEPDDEPAPPLAPALSWTIAAYLVPLLLYLGWAFTRSGDVPAGCVDASGGPCPSPRVEAAENLLGVLPAIVGALVLALLIALGLRRMATGWRAVSIGLAAAVIGGGIATFAAAALG